MQVEHIVQRGLLRREVVDIAGRDQRQLVALPQRRQAIIETAIMLLVMTLQFQEEVIPAEDGRKALGDLLGFV